MMPCDSAEQDLDDAVKVVNLFCDHSQVVDLRPAFVKMLAAFGGVLYKNRLAFGNLKARLRMAALYYEANRANALVCGTTNKTELCLGYFTKHGDGAVDIEPIADVWKTDIFELARYLCVPDCIVDKPPSAGLWEGQTDEDEIGMTYAEIDAALKRIEEGVAGGGIDEPIYGMMKASEHKRTMAPVCRLED